ncbi:hypothetical protein AAFF_G00397990 [Aldrovandia affinis]|uniref:Uncharacterized protein n=1 Tax=Aldrovandia affinis TaxID=143900 RepID=A0AAD7SFE4_9TELE|nr:hypothetical protein AAFF_G00397990 [Aldrovandia affinis]
MPKEQGCVGERLPRSSSKNAKDKSNSAFRGRANMAQGARGRASQCSSEKDSGYSDTGSDSLQMDLDEQRSSVIEPQRVGGGGVTLPCGEPTPVYIIKNLVVKQSGAEQLLHAPLRPRTPPQTPIQEGGGGSKKVKGTYLPILNTYPRIAPHPSRTTPKQGMGGRKGGTSEGHSLSKRLCVEQRKVAVSTTSQSHKLEEGRPRPHTHSHSHPRTLGITLPHSQPRPLSSLPRSCHGQNPPSRPASISCGLGSPSVSSSDAASSPFPAETASPAPGPARQRRFQNTVEILSQSGLLDVTLRTQELLRLSADTERDIAQLHFHTQLLCQAARTGVHAPAWGALLRAMAESGQYPSLEGAADASEKSRPTVTVAHGNNNAAPPSPLLAPTPDPPLDYPEEGHFGPPSHGHRVQSPPDIIMPPDSSTHGCLL